MDHPTGKSPRSIAIAVTPTSPFLDADMAAGDLFYGYLIKPVISRETFTNG